MSYINDGIEPVVETTHFNSIGVQVFQLIEDLEAVGNSSSPRGLLTKEANLATLEIDPAYSVMDFAARRFNWKYFAGELAWYLKADPSIDLINHFSSFWKGICPDGKANSNYGSLLFKRYPGEYLNQLEWVFNSLVNDKNSRQAVAFFNSPLFQYDGNRDFVCTMYVNFWIRKDYLDMKVQMRSNDIFFGLTYDAPWFSTLMQSMYLNLKEIYPKLKLGMYYHSVDNIHFYRRHFDVANKILDDGLDSFIKLNLRKPLFEFIKENEFDNGSNYRLVMTYEANSFVNMVEDLVDIGLSDDQRYWKTTLEYLYEISGDTLETSKL